jgi:hypothetical protein
MGQIAILFSRSLTARLNAHLSCWTLPLQQMQFLESFENPEWEIDLDAERIYNLAFKLV